MPGKVRVDDPHTHGNAVLPVEIDLRLRVVRFKGIERLNDLVDDIVRGPAWDCDCHFRVSHQPI